MTRKQMRAELLRLDAEIVKAPPGIGRAALQAQAHRLEARLMSLEAYHDMLAHRQVSDRKES